MLTTSLPHLRADRNHNNDADCIRFAAHSIPSIQLLWSMIETNKIVRSKWTYLETSENRSIEKSPMLALIHSDLLSNNTASVDYNLANCVSQQKLVPSLLMMDVSYHGQRIVFTKRSLNLYRKLFFKHSNVELCQLA